MSKHRSPIAQQRAQLRAQYQQPWQQAMKEKPVDEKRLGEIERDIGSEASPQGAAMARELLAEVRRLLTVNETLGKSVAYHARREAETYARAEYINTGVVRERRAERERCAKLLQGTLEDPVVGGAKLSADYRKAFEDAIAVFRALPDEG